MASNVIAIVPVSEKDRLGIPYVPQPYMVEYLCEVCGRKGWIGPKQLEIKEADPNTPVLCMICVINKAQQEQEFFVRTLDTDHENFSN